ncbi:hypothetical protein RJ639_017077 [Escallonia herrerae]|uniref:Pentatricopeptide repeat-containing protein n=1 Tax=Escallonia herrerae TaxID=1293975 RepID=A0AA88VFF1_9ASTE|nr:hypothetical protein RJ639_017077 [Escallonia herrerae]
MMEETKFVRVKPYVKTYTTLIHGWARASLLQKALRCFEQMKSAGLKPDKAMYHYPENMSRQEDEHEPKGLPAKEILADKAQSPKPFDAHTLRNMLSSYDLKILRDKCEIPPSVKLRLPGDGEAAIMTTLNEIGVYYDTFVNGFRKP